MRRSALSAVLTTLAAAFTVTAGIAASASGAADRPGDVNTDTAVNIADAILLARYCSEDSGAVLTPQGVRNADCNLDGFVGSEDSCVMLEYLAGLNRTLDPPEQPAGSEAVPDETGETAAETTQTEAMQNGTDGTETGSQTTAAEAETTLMQSTVTDAETTPGAGQTTAAAELTVGGRVLPLGRYAAEVTDQPELTGVFGSVTEKLTLPYNGCVTDFYVYAEHPADTLIMFSRDGIIIGYYTLAAEYSCSSQNYTVTGYIDTYSGGTGSVYAVIALHTSAFLSVDSVADSSDLSVFGKLSYYVTNALRALNGREPLRWNQTLADCALAHSLALAENNGGEKNKEHLDPVTGANPTERITEAVGKNCKPLGENVDKGFRHPFISAHKWYVSENGHRTTMLSPNFTDLGVGFAFLPQSNIYGTQDYAAIHE